MKTKEENARLQKNALLAKKRIQIQEEQAISDALEQLEIGSVRKAPVPEFDVLSYPPSPSATLRDAHVSTPLECSLELDPTERMGRLSWSEESLRRAKGRKAAHRESKLSPPVFLDIVNEPLSSETTEHMRETVTLPVEEIQKQGLVTLSERLDASDARFSGLLSQFSPLKEHIAVLAMEQAKAQNRLESVLQKILMFSGTLFGFIVFVLAWLLMNR